MSDASPISSLFPLAFAAGMLSTVNPCGLVLLPAYITHGLDQAAAGDLRGRLGHGLRAGVILTAGFAGTLSVIGLLVTAGASALLSAAPWLAVGSGAVLGVAGLAMLGGYKLGVRVPLPAVTTSPTSGARGLLLFGAVYGVATVSCSFGVMLAVIAQALSSGSLAGFGGMFAAYALGAAAVLMLLSITTAVAGGALVRRVRALADAMPAVTGVLLLVTAAYLFAYWLPTATGRGAPPAAVLRVAALASQVTEWLAAHQLLVAAVAGVAIAAAVAAAKLRWTVGASGRAVGPDTQGEQPAEPRIIAR